MPKSPKSPNAEMAQELFIYSVNHDKLYPQAQESIANLRRKVAKGVYNPERAIDLWWYFVTRAAKEYEKEFGTWPRTFGPAERRSAAQQVRDYYDDEVNANVDCEA